MSVRYWSARLTALTLGILLLAAVLSGAVVPGRFIVVLDTDPVAGHILKQPTPPGVHTAAALAYRGRLREDRDKIKAVIERYGTVLDFTDTVTHTLLVRLPDRHVPLVAAIAGVRRVVPVQTMKLFLDRAASVNRVTDAWNQTGHETAGSGIKIGVIDTGIDVDHAGFQDSSLQVPDGYPKTSSDSDSEFTNNKVIVARSYVRLLTNRLDPDQSARDRVGHGTAVAMAAAGVRNDGPRATIEGVAPKAFLGSYKVFGTPGFNSSSTTDAVLKAIDDAVSDGMDVINLSLGSDYAPRLEDDPEVEAIDTATRAGVIVVVAAGNNGPGKNRIASPGTAPSAVTVGASYNDRTFSSTVQAEGHSTVLGVPADNSKEHSPVSGNLSDVSLLDGTGQLCSELPSDSLAGAIALVLRGECTFETKLTYAKKAGAIGAVVYAAEDSPEAITMSVGDADLPAEMVSYSDGVSLKSATSKDSQPSCNLRFEQTAVSIDSHRLATFSAWGPNVNAGTKPDLVAVGKDVYTATQDNDENGSMYDEEGYTLADGTSFSTPIVAGAAALLKSARPGLTVEQYRSLLVNSSAAQDVTSGQSATVQQAGAGLLDASAALRSTITASPSALEFGSGGSTIDRSLTLTITNVGSSADTFTVLVSPRNENNGPFVSGSTIELAAGASVEVPVEWRATGLEEGAHEGFIRAVSSSSGTEARVPYWYGVTSGRPAEVSVLSSVTEGRSGAVVPDAIAFRILDSAGLTISDADPTVSSVSGGGSVMWLTSYDEDVPGLYAVTVRLSRKAGTNVFRIQAGDAEVEVSITVQ
ncbi:MAG: S8 family serine peptidase [Bryobacteraceae bacterium]|nr:S8 family serine peptidase [Bryobacteraceae bacterium]